VANFSRRTFNFLVAGCAAAPAAALGQAPINSQLQGSEYNTRDGGKPKVAMLLYPGLTLFDLIAPQTALAPISDIYLVWKNTDLLVSDSGIVLKPNSTFEDCPRELDVLFVPGGPGQEAIMRDSQTLQFLADRGARARYVTSVCSGALVLGAAGLLQGYKAGTHWAALRLLPLFGATPVNERVVVDRNRISGGGVTAGLDFGLILAAILAGEKTAKVQQLAMQYDPEPPFDVGVPSKAGPELTEEAIAWLKSRGIDMLEVSQQAAKAMHTYTPASVIR
jgi:transcriptional regulator GlxA family with amidase domain